MPVHNLDLSNELLDLVQNWS